MKAGYKQTEVGVIPEDWDALPASQIGRFRGGAGFPLSSQGLQEGEFPFYKVSDMNNEGNDIFMVSANNWISEETRRQLGAHAFPAGSIVFAKVGAAVFLERKKILSRPSCIDNNMAAFVLNEERSSTLFMHAQLLTKNLGDLVATTALPSLSGKVLGEIVLVHPPLPEQSAIATALGDVDALLAAQDALIAKKRAIKQGAMQELLTGKRRLPGFSGEWEVKRLGDVARIRNQKIATHAVDAGTLCVELENVGQGTGQLESRSTAGSAISTKYTFMTGDVLFGRLRSYLRKYWLATEPGLCTTEIWPLDADTGELSPGYLFAIVQTDAFIDAASISFGTHMPRADWGVMRNLEIRLPPLEEQTAIAAALSDMDTELTALEAQRAKTAQLKQGMMQALLTGRIRLV